MTECWWERGGVPLPIGMSESLVHGADGDPYLFISNQISLLQLHSHQSRLWRNASFLFTSMKRGGLNCYKTLSFRWWHLVGFLGELNGLRIVKEELLLLCVWYNTESSWTRSILHLFLKAFLSSKSERWLQFPPVRDFMSLAPSSCSSTLASAQDIETKRQHLRKWL
jgi:hypothetical protein